MLKKLRSSKKGFTLVEILVAVTILGIIVGPLLASMFSNNRVIEHARKQTEATYVAKRVMEETLSEYYTTLPTVIPNDQLDGSGQPTCIGNLIMLLGKSTTKNKCTSTPGYDSKYIDDFYYDIKIVPSGKIGMGSEGENGNVTANYLHVYRDMVGTQEFNFVVFPDGQWKYITLDSSTTNTFDLTPNGSNLRFEYNDSTKVVALDPAKKNLRIVTYSSNDASDCALYFEASSPWSNSCDRYLTNYTSRDDAAKTTVTVDTDFIQTEVENYYSSSRDQWDIALYEITVTVYEEGSDKPLSSAQGVVEVRIFPDIKK